MGPRWRVFLLIGLVMGVARADAEESEGCLNCHQYRGLSRLDASGKKTREFFVDPDYTAQGLGPHARLNCTDCHIRKEVEVFPHRPVTPVDCLRTCHLGSSSQAEVRFSHEPVGRKLA